MTEPKKIRLQLILISLVLFLAAGCRKKPTTQSDDTKTPATAVKQPQSSSKEESEARQGYKESMTPQNKEINSAVSEMLQLGSQWKPVFRNDWAKQAPDFTVDDIEGNTHKLSDYIGKNVIVVKLVTYDANCQKQISILKELRDAFTQEKLQILAISDEPVAKVKSFIEGKDLNFPIVAGRTRIGKPYRSVRHMPTSFYVGKDGIMKLAVEGVVELKDSKKFIETP